MLDVTLQRLLSPAGAKGKSKYDRDRGGERKQRPLDPDMVRRQAALSDSHSRVKQSVMCRRANLKGVQAWQSVNVAKSQDHKSSGIGLIRGAALPIAIRTASKGAANHQPIRFGHRLRFSRVGLECRMQSINQSVSQSITRTRILSNKPHSSSNLSSVTYRTANRGAFRSAVASHQS